MTDSPMKGGNRLVGFLAGGDYSGSANRYLFVALSASADTVVKSTGDNLPAAFGVLQTTGSQGMGVRVRTPGQFSKLRCIASTCNINIGNYIRAGSTGAGETQTSASGAYNAISLESLTSGSGIIEVYLVPTGATNAAS